MLGVVGMSAGQGQEHSPHGALAGRRIAITRPSEQAPELASQLEAAGASVMVLSAIAIEPLSDNDNLDAALSDFLNVLQWGFLKMILRIIFQLALMIQH